MPNQLFPTRQPCVVREMTPGAAGWGAKARLAGLIRTAVGNPAFAFSVQCLVFRVSN